MRQILVFAAAALGVAYADRGIADARSTRPVVSAARTAAVRDTAKTGTYDIEITTDAGTMTGELSLQRERDSIVVKLRAGANTPNVKSFTRNKQGYVLTVGHGDFTIVYALAFKGDSLSGTVNGSGGISGTVAGALKR